MLRSTLLCLILLPTVAPADPVAAGAKLYALHCAACHGADGRGTGTVGVALDDAPADLTALTRQNGGVFPVREVVAQIDGRMPLPGHGGEMPVYGWFFEGPEATIPDPDGRGVETTEAIALLIAWLQSAQR